jgi:transporter family protein
MVVLVMAWIVVFVTREQRKVKGIPRRDLLFICLSGIATGASWLCFYKALQGGPASLVAPIDKLSIVVTIAAAYFLFKERLTRKALVGLVLIVLGTMIMLL